MGWLGMLWLAAGCGRIAFDGRTGGDDTRGEGGVIATSTMTFGERPTSRVSGVTTDATLDGTQPTVNYGASLDLSIESPAPIVRAVLRFELSSIPPGTAVVEASVELVADLNGDEIPGLVGMFDVREDWNVATVTWTTRDAITPWLTPGGTGGVLLGARQHVAGSNVFAIERSIVQRWIDEPATNHGMLVRSADEPVTTHCHFVSSDGADPSRRPELTIVTAP